MPAPTYRPANPESVCTYGAPQLKFGRGAVGCTEADVPGLVEGTMTQQRLLATAPGEVTEDDVAGILRRSLTPW